MTTLTRIPTHPRPRLVTVSGVEFSRQVTAAPSETKIYELMALRQSNDLAGALRGEWPEDGDAA